MSEPTNDAVQSCIWFIAHNHYGDGCTEDEIAHVVAFNTRAVASKLARVALGAEGVMEILYPDQIPLYEAMIERLMPLVQSTHYREGES